MIEAVLFDVDGVLVHPWRFRDALTRDHGITPAMTAPFFRGAFEGCLLGRADLLDVLPPFLDAWGWRGSPGDFVEAWLAAEHAPHDAVLGIADELRRRHLPVGVASSQERHRARYPAEAMGFAQRFDHLFFSCDLGAAKPQRAFYAAITRRLGLPADHLLFFDDMAGNVEAARAEGWRAELFTSVEQLRADLAAHLDPDAA